MDSDQEEVIEQNIDPSALQIPEETIKLDIYQHLRNGIKNKDLNCLCENDLDNLYYCIPCKVSCCTKCNLREHSSHLLIQKEKYSLKPAQIDASFGPYEYMLENDDLFANISQKRKDLSYLKQLAFQEIKVKQEKTNTNNNNNNNTITESENEETNKAKKKFKF